jgi:hypothetical protein
LQLNKFKANGVAGFMWMDGGGMWQKITIFGQCEIKICGSKFS